MQSFTQGLVVLQGEHTKAVGIAEERPRPEIIDGDRTGFPELAHKCLHRRPRQDKRTLGLFKPEQLPRSHNPFLDFVMSEQRRVLLHKGLLARVCHDEIDAPAWLCIDRNCQRHKIVGTVQCLARTYLDHDILGCAVGDEIGLECGQEVGAFRAMRVASHAIALLSILTGNGTQPSLL